MSFAKIVVTVVSVVGMTMIGCGGDDGGGSSSTGGSGGSGGSGTGGSGGCDPAKQGGNDCPAYTNCAQSKCDAEYKDCLGASYKTGSFAGGKCETYMNCVVACNCDTTCTQKCQMDATCQTCMTTTLSGCVTSQCSAELQQCAGTGGATGTGGASGGGTCADLAACCASLSGNDKTNCETTYNQIRAGGDSVCNTLLQTYKSSGKC